MIDLLIGGSPCQSFSFAGTMSGMTTKDKVSITTLEQYLELKNKGFEFEGYSYLFWEYIKALKKIKPKYFLLENVKMSKKWQDVITEALGVEPILINSELVSAQSRERLYWTNIPNVTQPEDKYIYIDDIIQNDIEHTYLPRTRLDYSNYDKTKVDKSIFKNTATQIGNSRNFGNAVRSNGKAFTLRRVNPNGIIDENYNIREFTPIEVERLQTLPDNYTLIDGIKRKERYEVCGNGWTVDIIAHILRFIPDTYLHTVVSLFDGISCGQVAIKRSGKIYNQYYASEINDIAIQITMKNHPHTLQIGDVSEINWDAFLNMIGIIRKAS